MSPITPYPASEAATEARAEMRAQERLAARLKRYFRSRDHLRRGICLLNAGHYDAALQSFGQIKAMESQLTSLPALIAACYDGKGEYENAVESLKSNQPAAEGIENAIRQSLLQWKAGRRADAIGTLRQAIAHHPETAELHFQLGTLLAAMDDFGEAELRFSQAVAINPTHFEALIALAQCHAVRGQVPEAARYLERAQRRRPSDARVNLLVTEAAKCLADQGIHVSVHAVIPPEPTQAQRNQDIDRLSQVIEQEPEFVDAFLGLPSQEMNAEIYATLAETINRALDRHPADAKLLCAQGGVYRCLGQPQVAIAATEKAIDADPRYVRALIQLGQLYMETDRCKDAVRRFEQALDNGVRYADVYYLLGNLYRRDGNIEGARQAYRQALNINKRYEAARQALDSLAA